MERIETIDLKTETDALEEGRDITLYTFDEYGRLMHYATIDASTPQEREAGDKAYFLTISKGGEDLREFQEQDDEDYPDLESAVKRLGTIWKGRIIWWERDGSVPGVDDGITFDELRGADMLDNARKRFENEMRPRGIEPDGAHGMDARDVPGHAEHAERVGDFQAGNPSLGHPPRSVCRAENNNGALTNQPI